MPTERKPLGVHGGALEPRYSCFYAVDGHRYRYSKLTHTTDGRLTSDVYRLLIAAFKATGIAFDVVLFNYYEDGKQYVSPHFDADALTTAVASFSFGGARLFRIFFGHADSPTVRDDLAADLRLTDGSFLLMHAGFQQKYKHALPAVANAGPRINGTCRQHNADVCLLLAVLFGIESLEPIGPALLLVVRYLFWTPDRVYS
jgi:alkylated DNA repair dioxygenase AlkB